MRWLLIHLFGWSLACLTGAANELAHPIDLRGYYNFSLTNSTIGTGSLNGPNNLAAFPAGRALFGNVPFDVSGLIQLSGNQAMIAKRSFPEKIEGIKIGLPSQRLHLLHGAGWNEVEATVIATIIVHYTDGAMEKIPIVYGKHVYDWWVNDEKPTDPSTTVAWTGANRVSKMFGTELRVYRTTFPNPRPGAVISHIDYVSAKTQSAPFLLGLTIE